MPGSIHVQENAIRPDCPFSIAPWSTSDAHVFIIDTFGSTANTLTMGYYYTMYFISVFGVMIYN